jgi:mRNA-degrading endonuclease toxin of MazEF toxin-antitoxin module
MARSVSEERLIEKIGEITPDEVTKVQEGIVKVLGI